MTASGPVPILVLEDPSPEDEIYLGRVTWAGINSLEIKNERTSERISYYVRKTIAIAQWLDSALEEGWLVLVSVREGKLITLRPDDPHRLSRNGAGTLLVLRAGDEVPRPFDEAPHAAGANAVLAASSEVELPAPDTLPVLFHSVSHARETYLYGTVGDHGGERLLLNVGDGWKNPTLSPSFAGARAWLEVAQRKQIPLIARLQEGQVTGLCPQSLEHVDPHHRGAFAQVSFLARPFRPAGASVTSSPPHLVLGPTGATGVTASAPPEPSSLSGTKSYREPAPAGSAQATCASPSADIPQACVSPLGGPAAAILPLLERGEVSPQDTYLVGRVMSSASASFVLNAGGKYIKMMLTPGDLEAESWLKEAACMGVSILIRLREGQIDGLYPEHLRHAAPSDHVALRTLQLAAQHQRTQRFSMSSSAPLPLSSFGRAKAVLLEDGEDAAYRVAASQLVKATREPLIAVLHRHLGPDDDRLRAKIAAFLETEIGGAMFAALLSLGLSTMPAGESEIPARLGRELRVRSIAGLGDLTADVLMGPFREIVATHLRGVSDLVSETPPAELGPRPPRPEAARDVQATEAAYAARGED